MRAKCLCTTLFVTCLAQVSSLSAQSGAPNEYAPPAGYATEAYQSGQPIQAKNPSIKATHKIKISAQADGLIKALNADEGVAVSKDQVVIVIDSQIAAAELAVAKKQLEAAEIIAKQTANIEYSKMTHELAKEEYSSIYKLHQSNAANYSEVRRKYLEREKARFSIDMADDEHAKAKLDAAVASEQARASQVKLDMYEVVAPYDGIIVERLRDIGEWIRAGEPIFRLVHLNEMKIEAYVPLRGISPNDLIDAKMDISIPLNRRDQATYEARVEFVSPEILNNEVKVVAKLKNQKDINGRWVLSDGMQARVTVTLP